MDSNKDLVNIYINNIINEDYDEKETVGIRGEYWFEDDGSIIFADGDIGDIGHEGIVIRQMTGQLCSEFDISCDEPYLDTNTPLEQDIISRMLQDDDFLRAKFKLSDDVDFDDVDIDFANELELDPADAMTEYLIFHGMDRDDANDMVFISYGSTTDAREYAIKKWGWKRVQGDSIETNRLTPKDLKAIARGIENALSDEGLNYEYEDDPDVLDLHEYTVSLFKGNRYGITLRDMISGEVQGLERSDIEVPVHAATQQVRQMDVAAMPDYYKQRGVIGDSVERKSLMDVYSEVLLEGKRGHGDVKIVRNLLDQAVAQGLVRYKETTSGWLVLSNKDNSKYTMHKGETGYHYLERYLMSLGMKTNRSGR